jgi:hypothetical protein
MPIHLETIDFGADLYDFTSVLVVLCPVCPQVSLAMQEDSPWIEFFETGFRTGAVEHHIDQLLDPLRKRGVRTGVFTSRVPIPTMCLWTEGQRRRLFRRAKDYEAVIVLGCDSAAYTAQQVLRTTDCHVLQGMRMSGITNATITHRFPLTLELKDKTRVSIGQVGGRTSHE